jgi:hypothetical protein
MHVLALALLTGCGDPEGARLATDVVAASAHRRPRPHRPDPYRMDADGDGYDLRDDCDDDDATVHAGCVVSPTWSLEETVATGDLQVSFNNAPFSARAEDGGLHVVWADAGVPTYARRAPGGTTWDEHVVPGLGGLAAKPTLALVGEEVLVAWTASTLDGTTVVINRSLDDGASWLGALALSEDGDDGGGVSLNAQARAGVAGATLAWTDAASVGPDWDVDAFTTAQWLDTGDGASGDVQVFGAEPTAFAVWDNDRAGARQVFLASSSDGGLTFSAERELGVTQTGRTYNAGNDASACLDGDDLYVGYQDAGQVYLAGSQDGGATFDALGALGSGLFAHVACDGGDLAVAWESFTGSMFDDAGKTVGLALSTDGFVTVDTPHAMPDSETATGRIQPGVWLADDALDVWWLDGATLGHAEAAL